MVAREFIPLNIGVLRVLETGALADDADVESIVERLGEVGHVVSARETVTDSKSLIREQLTTWITDRGIDVILAMGGVDSTPTDPMLDALAPLVTRQFFGFGELFRAIIHEEAGTASIFSHAEAALCNSTYVILLPATGFTTAAVERLLLPQLDHRTLPRNLAMSLPRLAGVPQETMGGDTPPPSSRGSIKPPPVPRTVTGTIPVMQPPPVNAHSTNRIAVPPSPPPAPPKRPSTQIPVFEPAANPVRRPPTSPGVAVVTAEDPAPARPRNPFADALKDAAQQRRTASIVAQMPTKPVEEPAVIVSKPTEAAQATQATAAAAVARVVPAVASAGPVSEEIEAAPEPESESDALPESSSGTIDMDALLAAANSVEEPEVVKPKMTMPPPFVPRTTSSLPIVKAPDEAQATHSTAVTHASQATAATHATATQATAAAAVARSGPTPAPATAVAATPAKKSPNGDFRELAITPSNDRGAPRMFVEGRRKRRKASLPVILLLVVAGMSVVVAGVVVYMSVMRSHSASAKNPQNPPPSPPVDPKLAVIEMDAAVVPEHDPVVVDAGEIEMPAFVETVDAGALALKPPTPVHPVPQHDPVAPPDAAVPVPMHDDGCDEVSCVLDHYARACCAGWKPKDPDPVVIVPTNTTPAKLDRAMVAPAIESIKPGVISCGERPNAPKGTVKLQVHVNPDGHVKFVTVAETPEQALGDCVSMAMQRAVFPVTQTGGAFTYPFVF